MAHNSTNKSKGTRGKEVVKNKTNLECLRENLFKLTSKYSCSQLEELTDVADSSIKAITNGNRPNPKIDNLISIAKGLNCSIDYLVGLSAIPNREWDDFDKASNLVQKETGLSYDSIEILSHLFMEIDDKNLFSAFNELIESSYFYSLLLYWKTYLFFDKGLVSIIEKGKVDNIDISFSARDYEKKLIDALDFYLSQVKRTSLLLLNKREEELKTLQHRTENGIDTGDTIIDAYDIREQELQTLVEYTKNEKAKREQNKILRKEEIEIFRKERKENNNGKEE